MNRAPSKTSRKPVGEPLQDPYDHLSIEILSAYHRRVLSPQESSQARSHMVRCAACRALLLDLARFLDDAQGSGQLTVEEVEDARRKLEVHTRARVR